MGDDVKFVVAAARLFAFQSGGGVGDGDATLDEQIDQIALYQRFHQLAPLAGKRLFQLIEFAVGVLKFPVSVLLSIQQFLNVPIRFLKLAVGLLLRPQQFLESCRSFSRNRFNISS